MCARFLCFRLRGRVLRIHLGESVDTQETISASTLNVWNSFRVSG